MPPSNHDLSGFHMDSTSPAVDTEQRGGGSVASCAEKEGEWRGLLHPDFAPSFCDNSGLH